MNRASLLLILMTICFLTGCHTAVQATKVPTLVARETHDHHHVTNYVYVKTNNLSTQTQGGLA